MLFKLLFNVYSNVISTEAQSNKEALIVINGNPIKNVRYADDTVLLRTVKNGNNISQ